MSSSASPSWAKPWGRWNSPERAATSPPLIEGGKSSPALWGYRCFWRRFARWFSNYLDLERPGLNVHPGVSSEEGGGGRLKTITILFFFSALLKQ